MSRSRREFLTGVSASAAAAALAGCSVSGGSGGTATPEGYEVGYGDYQTTVSPSNFPETLYIYAVQTGWSNWGAIMESFESEYGVALNDDQRSSGEALQDIRANAQDPTHSAYNGGYTYGILAMQDDFTTDYKPANWDKVPDKLKTDNGHMTATRQMTTTVTYRADIYEERGIEPPETWEDLKNPDIAQDLVFQPPEAAVGLAGALSINNAYGGSLDDVGPVVDYYNELQEMGATFRGNLEGDFTSGNVVTFVEYDYTGLDLKYNSDAVGEDQVGVSLLAGPDGEPGAMQNPYGYGMLADAPNPDAAKLFMDYVLSLEGQRQFLDAYVRPIRASELDMPDEFPDQSRYEETQFGVDYEKMVDNQESIIQQIGEGVGLTGY
ncbi:extracellular solute-binding protein [Halosimplex rubrum]|uniref:Extracellular solute-binding protein n=1 Tax=Halosimplex rubrum TaxID=869889 RepID=A0A7D5P217_9EURY|nr:extracellular solute-binding protein [Halosimplex rubrum]QLH76124.1 extracellular solute-binding protein [Halosimplex rubrum]